MKLITVQSRTVLDLLLSQKMYYADFSRVSENLIGPYKNMQKLYKWRSCPVFAAPIGYNVEFYGAKIDNSALLCLDVSEKYIRYQQYYEWTDFIFYSENPDKDVPDANTIIYNISRPREKYIVQATLPYIKPSWLDDYCFYIPQKFKTMHIGSGGQNKLQSFCYYTKNKTERIS